MHDFRLEPYRPDDNELIEPINDKTLLGFIKEGLRTPKLQHKYFFVMSISLTICFSIFLVFFVINPVDDTYSTKPVLLNPEY
jgi:hypothetical protein